MNTMEITKVVGGLCGTFLIFLLAKWGAETLYHTGDGHGDEAHSAYVIEVESDGDAAATDAPEVSIEELLASADVGKGERVFGKCKACHKLEDGANATGPHLFAVVNRQVAAVSGYDYSDGMAGHGGAWDVETLNSFLENPKDEVPGTKMSFAGLKKPEDRANLIAYLETVQ
ncbi:c-type cytochrome [Oceanomicrobium pacificus]|uniref:C-type cytochrome n=1 Tax=Oceanomicrobium pacificus TaxID=2692916 RepID=A0A6B0TZ70_9RHOB|nr:cytochrome c family protein [Oceanomicrobium pacificus]MXU64201.1 c-type cytochrome [Oceanomicrobium pacificus]